MREGTGIRITQDADILRVPAPIAGRVDAGHLLQKEIAATVDADLTPEITIGITKGKKEDPAQEPTMLRGRPRNARWLHYLIRDLRISSRGLLRARPKLKKGPCFLPRLAVSTSLLSSFVR